MRVEDNKTMRCQDKSEGKKTLSSSIVMVMHYKALDARI